MRYSGEHMDLIALQDMRAQTATDGISIYRIDTKTGYPACTMLRTNGLTVYQPRFYHNGVPTELRFENNVLTRYRECGVGLSQWAVGSTKDYEAILADYAFQVKALT